jgi:hypothetical protein
VKKILGQVFDFNIFSVFVNNIIFCWLNRIKFVFKCYNIYYEVRCSGGLFLGIAHPTTSLEAA